MVKINRIFISIVPMGAVRTTKAAAGWGTKSMAKYAAYKKQIGYIIRKHFKQPFTGPIMVDVTYYMPIPKKGKSQGRMVSNGDYCTTKPDIDNIEKGLFDSLNKIAWKDDNQVCEVHSRKLYSINPGIALELWELLPDGEKSASNEETART